MTQKLEQKLKAKRDARMEAERQELIKAAAEEKKKKVAEKRWFISTVKRALAKFLIEADATINPDHLDVSFTYKGTEFFLRYSRYYHESHSVGSDDYDDSGYRTKWFLVRSNRYSNREHYISNNLEDEKVDYYDAVLTGIEALESPEPSQRGWR